MYPKVHGLSSMILYLWVWVNPPPSEAKFSLSSITLNVESICYKTFFNILKHFGNFIKIVPSDPIRTK